MIDDFLKCRPVPELSGSAVESDSLQEVKKICKLIKCKAYNLKAYTIQGGSTVIALNKTAVLSKAVLTATMEITN